MALGAHHSRLDSGMARNSVTVRVLDHLFGVVDKGPIDIKNADWSNGLAVLVPTGALIYTGIDRGSVSVTVKTFSTAPTQANPGTWDEIVEVSVYAPAGQLAVHQLEYRFDEDSSRLPLLSSNGPGDYRLRVHAHGRDTHFDKVRENSGEKYLIYAWPNIPQPPLIVRATDQAGYGLRLSSLADPDSP